MGDSWCGVTRAEMGGPGLGHQVEGSRVDAIGCSQGLQSSERAAENRIGWKTGWKQEDRVQYASRAMMAVP